MIKYFIILFTSFLFITNTLVGYEFNANTRTLNVSSFEELIIVPRIIRHKVKTITGITPPAPNDEAKWGIIFNFYGAIGKIENNDVPWKNNVCFPTGITYRRFVFALNIPDIAFDWNDIPEYIKKDCRRLFTNNSNIFNDIYTHLPNLKRIYFYGTKLPAIVYGKNIFGGTISEPTTKLIKFQAPNVEYNADAFIECPNLQFIRFKKSSGVITIMIIDDLTNLPTEQNSNITKVIITDAINEATSDNIIALKDLYENLEDIEITEYDLIGEQLFYDADATWLKSFTAHKVHMVGQAAFYQCAALKSIYLPNATTINPSAFWDCINLTDVFLPTATSIGVAVFNNCTALENLYLCSSGSFAITTKANLSDDFTYIPANNINLYLEAGDASIGTKVWEKITFKNILECSP